MGRPRVVGRLCGGTGRLQLRQHRLLPGRRRLRAGHAGRIGRRLRRRRGRDRRAGRRRRHDRRRRRVAVAGHLRPDTVCGRRSLHVHEPGRRQGRPHPGHLLRCRVGHEPEHHRQGRPRFPAGRLDDRRQEDARLRGGPQQPHGPADDRARPPAGRQRVGRQGRADAARPRAGRSSGRGRSAAVSGRRWIAAVAAGTLALASCGPRHDAASPRRPAWPAGRWVDLTHPFDATTIFWPTERGFTFEEGRNGFTEKGYYYAANRFATPEHGGTHLDAPRHFSATGLTADAIPLDRLVGEAAVVDVSDRCAADPVYEVSADDLVAWERRHRRQLVDVILLIRTGWAARWGDRTAYLGTAEQGPAAVARLRFPGLSPLAARWLVDHRRVRAVGIDTASIDHGPSTLFGAHVALCGADVPVFENLAALDGLPEEGAFVAALPMKIAGGSGGPLRIVARLPAPP
ncbi:MAG: cyclase family protein [Planctomycetia bacterium]|nr:cyclase family protein [Planctomycetia bacterium]